MVMDYSALYARIIEAFGTIAAFAEAVGTNSDAVGRRLIGKTEIKAKEIIVWAKALDVENDIEKYFFCTKNLQ